MGDIIIDLGQEFLLFIISQKIMKKITIIVNYNHIGRIRIMDHHGLYLFIDRIFFVMLYMNLNVTIIA